MTHRTPSFGEQLSDALDRPEPGLAESALLIAHLEYPRLDPHPYLERLDRMGEAAASRMEPERARDRRLKDFVATLNQYLFDELGFFGNREHYDDPRNSCLNEVLDRRTGIPLTLSVVYIEIARRAGLHADGVNFPGHFLVRVVDDVPPAQPPRTVRARSAASSVAAASAALIVDPFHGGAILDEGDCRLLLHRHVGEAAAFNERLLAPATRRQILVRMLLNLKRLYVRMRSFPQARVTSDLLLAIEPSSISELRDRGLLAYHMNDFSGALRDLEEYLRLAKPDADDEDEKREMQQLWEHVKTLRRRIASFN